MKEPKVFFQSLCNEGGGLGIQRTASIGNYKGVMLCTRPNEYMNAPKEK